MCVAHPIEPKERKELEEQGWPVQAHGTEDADGLDVVEEQDASGDVSARSPPVRERPDKQANHKEYNSHKE